MAWYRCGGGGLPAGLQSDMDTVLNKKFSTSTTYPPTDWPDTVNLLGPLPEKTASSASVCSFSDGADDVPMKSVIAHIAPTLTGTNAVNMKQTGKNFLPIAVDYPNFTQTKNGMTISVLANGKVKFNGTTTANTDFAFYSASTPSAPYLFVRNGTYTFSNIGNSNVKMVVSGGSNNGFPYREIANSFYTGTVTDETKPFNYVIFRISSGVTLSDVEIEPMLEVGSTATAYEPYKTPTSYTANLGRTVYGGQADIVNGQGIDDVLWANLSDVAWTEDTNRAGVFYGSVAGRKTATADDASEVLACTCYDVNNVAVTTGIDNYISGARSYGGNIIFFRDSSMAGYTRAQVQEALQGEKVCVCSANPTAFTFDGQEIPSLLGVNNLWHDAGETECTYRADISLALQAINGGRGLMMMRPTEPEETEETEETEGLEDELNR